MKLEDIARLAGVSRTTASYVINGKAQQYRISEKTQQKVLSVVEKYNFQPDRTAASLRAGNTMSLGFIMPDLENTSYARLAKRLEKGARKAGYQLIITCSDDQPEVEIKLAQTLMSRRIDALIVASCLPPDNEFYPQILQRGVPVIAVDRLLNDEHFANVISENLIGAESLTMSVLSPQTRSVGLIGAIPSLSISREREQGFRSAIRRICPHAKITTTYGDHFHIEEGQQLIHHWIESPEALPEVIITTAYVLLEGVLDELQRFPEILGKVHFATFGDNRLLDFLPVKINSLPQQMDLIADSALTLALEATKGNFQPGVEVIDRLLKKR